MKLTAYVVSLTLRVHIEGLLPSDWVCSHDGMFVHNRFTTLDTALLHTGVDLLNARVCRLESVQKLLESR